MLINDILDLSKIESGTVVVDVGELRFNDLRMYVERTFRHVAEAKGVTFAIELSPSLPKSCLTDAKRLQQVLKNLLSNAFKFTHQGSVSLTMDTARAGWSPDNDNLNYAGTVLAISVSDTGIGISPDKQHIIFEAFQQADGSTSRKYGGTGLGLAISREIARLLGGEIRLVSSPGKGSIFTLYLPQNYAPVKSIRKYTPGESTIGMMSEVNGIEHVDAIAEVAAPVDEVGDDRNNILPGDQVVLIVDNDVGFAKLVLESARERGFKGLVTSLGAAALALARDHSPSAITLDICLPDIDGWRVLDRLKHDIGTRHIPVFVISTEEDADRSRELGALGVLKKPIRTKEMLDGALNSLRDFVQPAPTRRLLLLEHDAVLQERILDFLQDEDVLTTVAHCGKDALALLPEQQFDCIVVDSRVPDINAVEFLEELKLKSIGVEVPLIIYSENDLGDRDELVEAKRDPMMPVKVVRSLERLFDQAGLFLHRPVAKLPESKRRILEQLHSSATMLTGKTVLVVDDDIRNIFALTSVLERQDMNILSAETGRAPSIFCKPRRMSILC